MDGEKLKEVRKDHNDTQESLAKKLGVSTSAVSKWEQGYSDPDVKTLIEICRLYDVTSDFLLGLSDDDPLITKKKRSVLSEKSKETLRQFEAFLLHQDRKNAKK